MSLFDRNHPKHFDSPGDARRDASAPAGSNADAEESAAHIAELVRRTAERLAAPGPSSVARPDVTAVARPDVTAAARPDVTAAARPDVTAAARPDVTAAARPDVTAVPSPSIPSASVAQPARPVMRQPSRRTLVAAGAVAAVFIGGAVALSHPAGSEAGPPPPTPGRSAPTGYAVKVTDVITDCASHARGRAKSSFETQKCVKATRSLATGRVRGRPALFVTSRVQMASAEAAASVKQVLDGNGTGNLNDLLREGRSFPGAPETMPASGYASVQTAKVVTVAEAGFVDGGRSSSTEAALRAAAAQVAALVSTQG
jgi:hypothetical protein